MKAGAVWRLRIVSIVVPLGELLYRLYRILHTKFVKQEKEPELQWRS